MAPGARASTDALPTPRTGADGGKGFSVPTLVVAAQVGRHVARPPLKTDGRQHAALRIDRREIVGQIDCLTAKPFHLAGFYVSAEHPAR
jgi:hypothetical protein